jgi:hexulose-6-phosphate isomerase
MENPPWKSDSEQLFACVESILIGMAEIGAKILVIPLVDNSSLGDSNEFSQVVHFFRRLSTLLLTNDLKIAFETDLGPKAFADFLSNFDKESFGVNYDIGNSASFGFNPTEEFAAVGSRILNVHVKDRMLGGTTVPLGTGNADFPTVFRCLNDHGYVGNLIMQTARAQDGKHAEVLAIYREQIARWTEEAK